MTEEKFTVPAQPGCEVTPDGHCTVCGDQALVARVISVDGAARAAEVELEGAVRVVALDLVDGVRPGDAVLVHQGFAIGRMERT